MKKAFRYILIALAALVILGTVASITGALKVVVVQSSANEPSIKLKQKIFVSTFVKPDRFDFGAYYGTSESMGRILRIHRLCGLEGDTVEIRNGNLFVNGSDADKDLSLLYTYNLHLSELQRLETFEPIREWATVSHADDSVVLTLPKSTVAKYSVKAKRVITPSGEADEYFYKKYNTKWNKDHFGPLVIPSGKYFFLGDNRDGSEDSRYIGLIDKSDYFATVLWQ